MGFIDTIKARAKADKKTIVLPESEDRRTYEAAAQILKEDLANLIIIGSEEAVKKGSEGLDVSKATIVDPEKNEKTQAYVDKLVELRAKKGMTPEKARETILNDYTYYGVMMVKMGDADGLVSGACHSTANTLRPCLCDIEERPCFVQIHNLKNRTVAVNEIQSKGRNDNQHCHRQQFNGRVFLKRSIFIR